MTVEEILAALETLGPAFPREAVEEASARREEITPELLRILRETADDPQRLLDRESYMAPIYAFYLLAQFREPRACPLIAQLFSRPGEEIVNATGDFVTEALGRVLASTCGDDLAPIKALIEDEQANEWVRGQALHALAILVAVGEAPRDEVMAYYKNLFHTLRREEESVVWGDLVYYAAMLHPAELMAEIDQAYADGLIDEFAIDRPYVDEKLAMGQEELLAELRERSGIIKDTVAEMEWWAAFEEEPPDEDDIEYLVPESSPWFEPAPKQLPIHVERKVGRNEPCPCGSGKKYKHCCGSPAARRAQ